jgi:hypothetical protein
MWARLKRVYLSDIFMGLLALSSFGEGLVSLVLRRRASDSGRREREGAHIRTRNQLSNHRIIILHLLLRPPNRVLFSLGIRVLGAFSPGEGRKPAVAVLALLWRGAAVLVLLWRGAAVLVLLWRGAAVVGLLGGGSGGIGTGLLV